MNSILGKLCLAGLLLAACGGACAVTPDKFDPAEFVKPICPANYDRKDADNSCEPLLDKINKLGEQDCKSAGFDFTAEVTAAPAKPSSCKPGAAKAPAPVCRLLPSYASTLKDKQCTYAKLAATSAPGNYVGDCIRVDGVPAGMDVQTGQHYVVTGQRKAGEDEDKLLTAVHATKREMLGIDGWTFTCHSQGGKTVELSANALLDAGARRYGIAFGALALPYKYFRKEGAFVTGIPIGLYSGYRWGAIGSGITLAFGATVGNVKADTVQRDANGTVTSVTGTAEVAAIGTTMGLIWDVSKARDTRAFKMGLFYGSDRVSKDQKTIDYKYNKRPWFALQIGYDFTDN